MALYVTAVDENSPAERFGLTVGCALLAIDGHPLNDALDYQFYTTPTSFSLEVCENEQHRTVQITKAEYEPLGCNFKTYLGDEKHSCANHCMFCFIDQLPPGMREPLYFKDDDERLSFLFGNYITLTNLTDHEIDRIIQMHISPIFVSVHTTNPELRVELMKNPRSGEVLKYIPQLAAHHIRINAQIVVCPGLNDGEELRRSLWDLGQYAPEVQSIALVPVGLTGHREGLYPLRMMTPEEAADCIRIADEFGEEMLRRHGNAFERIPAAKSVHHAFLGGLLMHTANMMKLADFLAELYRDTIDRSLLLAGTLLHDMAKEQEFVFSQLGLATDYSVKGQLLGHLVMGAQEAARVAETLHVPEEKSVLLQHLILSHHGEPEFGAAVRPLCAEAELLSLIDAVDSRMEIYRETYDTMDAGTFSPRIFALEKKVFKHD